MQPPDLYYKESYGWPLYGMFDDDVRPWPTIRIGTAEYKCDGIPPVLPISGTTLQNISSNFGSYYTNISLVLQSACQRFVLTFPFA